MLDDSEIIAENSGEADQEVEEEDNPFADDDDSDEDGGGVQVTIRKMEPTEVKLLFFPNFYHKYYFFRNQQLDKESWILTRLRLSTISQFMILIWRRWKIDHGENLEQISRIISTMVSPKRHGIFTASDRRS